MAERSGAACPDVLAGRRPERQGDTVSGAQIAFSIALGLVTLVITGFALYVASSTMWGDRWYGRRKPDDSVSK